MNTPQKISVIFTIGLFFFWLYLLAIGSTDGFYNYLYSFLFGLTPLIAGIIAIRSSKLWGGMKTALGKAIFYIGLGVLLWGLGETIWSYYTIFLGVAAPYPSLADIGFAPSIFFYGIGAFYLSKVTGAKFGLRNKAAKVAVVISLIITTVLAYYISIELSRGGVLVPEGDGFVKAIFDIAYPLGDFLALVVAVVVSGLSFKYMGGRYKYDIVAVLCGLFVMYVADSVFSYTTSIGTYYNANWGDLLLTLGTFLLSYGVLGFYNVKESPVAEKVI